MNEHSLISSPATGTRAQLVDAAERVLRSKGLARATTKEIAREAGCAEGTLYLHFADKLDLVRAVHEKLLPAFIEVVSHLPGRAGDKRLEGQQVVRKIIDDQQFRFDFAQHPASSSLTSTRRIPSRGNM